MSMFDEILEQVLKAEIALYHARCRLQASTDGEALHDLRIQLRRLRSLLRPLRKIDSVGRLDSAAAAVGNLTVPVRDLEVLINELEQKGYRELAASRRAALRTSVERVLQSRALAILFAELDEWPRSFRAERMAGKARNLGKLISKRLDRQVQQLAQALGDPKYDRHKLRILAKHARYMIDAYPRQAAVSQQAVRSLKTVLSALGTWHDLSQWCLKAASERDLQPLLAGWQKASISALQDAEAEILRLRLNLGHESGSVHEHRVSRDPLLPVPISA